MYPFNHKMAQKLQTDAGGVSVDRGFIAHFQVSAEDAVAAATDGVHAAITLADGETTEVTTEITNPAVPRNLTITGNVAGISGNVVIVGTNYADEEITETIVANGDSTVEGNKAFKTVTSITVPARNAEGDTIIVGWGDKLGLPYKLAHNAILATYLDNTLEGTAPTVTVDSSNIEGNTIDLNSALDGSVVDVYLIV